MATVGMYIKPIPSPVHIPWARKICQYFVARLVMNVPNTPRKHPRSTVCWANPASADRPEKALIKKVRKTWDEPIQETCEGGRDKAVV